MKKQDPALVHFLKTSTAYRARLAKASARARRLGPLLAMIRGIPSLGESKVSVSEDYLGGVWVYVTLNTPETSFVRDLVRATGARAKKAKSWDDQTLTATLDVRGYQVQVTGYKPETCAVVYEDVERVIENAQVRADGSVVVTEKKARVVCSPQEDVTPDA